MSLEPLSLVTAFLIGLGGGVHCVGMCGGIVGTLALSGRGEGRPRLGFHLAYNAGRLFSYTVAGALLGGVGLLTAQLVWVNQAQMVLLGIAGIFMILLGFYLAGWWLGLARIERAGGVLWRWVEPFAARLLPVRSYRNAFLLGLLWGWLPCGLVYSMLIWAMSSGGPLEGALLLLSFGFGTLPNLLAMGYLAGWLSSWVRRPAVRAAAGGLVVVFGVITLWRAFA